MSLGEYNGAETTWWHVLGLFAMLGGIFLLFWLVGPDEAETATTTWDW